MESIENIEVVKPVEEVLGPVTLANMKVLLKAHVLKKNKLGSYGRTIVQVYYCFKIANVHELLSTKEQDIIHYFKKEIRKHFYYKKQVV